MPQNEYIPDTRASFALASQLFKEHWVKLSSIYLFGVVPFQVFLVYFFLELGYSGNAKQNVFWLSIIATLFFYWMKIFQSIFSTYFYSLMREEPLSVSFNLKEIFYQISVQSFGLIAYTFSSIVFITLQANINVLNYSLIVTPEKQKMTIMERLKYDWKQGKNFAENSLLSFYFMGVAIFIFINVVSIVLLSPYALKTLFGIETIFIKSPFAFFNLITFIIIFNFTFLICDPIFKCVFALRYYYKIALPKGGDLQFRIKKIFKWASVLLVFLLIPEFSSAKENTKESLESIINQKKYQWREGKKQKLNIDEKSFFQSIIDWLDDRLRNLFGNDREQGDSSKTPFFTKDLLMPFLIVLITIFVVMIALILYRSYRSNAKQKARLQKPLKLDKVNKKPVEERFDEFNEEEWNKAANEYVQNGDFRGAIRALFYQSLMTLGEKNLLLVQRYKTNSQYRSELKLRAHSLPNASELFVQIVLAFDEAWFSEKDITDNEYERVYSNVKELKGLFNA